MEKKKIIIGVAVGLILAVMVIGISMALTKSGPAKNLPTGMVNVGVSDDIASFVDMDSVEKVNGKVRFRMKAYKTQTPSKYAIFTHEADPADGRVTCLGADSYEDGIYKGSGQYHVKNPYPKTSPLGVARDLVLKKAGY